MITGNPGARPCSPFRLHVESPGTIESGTTLCTRLPVFSKQTCCPCDTFACCGVNVLLSSALMMRKLPFPHRLLPVGLLHESTAATATKSPNQSFRIVPPAVELDLYGTPQNYRGLRPWPEPP